MSKRCQSPLLIIEQYADIPRKCACVLVHPYLFLLYFSKKEYRLPANRRACPKSAPPRPCSPTSFHLISHPQALLDAVEAANACNNSNSTRGRGDTVSGGEVTVSEDRSGRGKSRIGDDGRMEVGKGSVRPLYRSRRQNQHLSLSYSFG